MQNDAEKTTGRFSTESSFAIAYYEHQYDRMAKQEEQRHSITNIVVSLSIVAFTFAFDSDKRLNMMTGLLLPAVIMSANLAAMVYMERSRSWIRTHRARAKRVLATYAPELNGLDKATPETFKRYWLGRGRIQKILHLIITGASCVPIAVYLAERY